MKALIAGDLHLRVKSPPSRHDYMGDFKRKWKELQEMSISEGVDCIILTGDVFNSYHPGGVPYSLLAFALVLFKASVVPVYSIAGNHDQRSESDDVLYRSPIGVLFRSGYLKRLSSSPESVNGVSIYGSELPLTIDSDPVNYCYRGEDNRPKIFVSHGELVFPGHSSWSPIVTRVEDLELMDPHYDVIVNGHLHSQQALYGKKTLFVSPGSFMRDFDLGGNLPLETRVVLLELTKERKNAKMITLKKQIPFSEAFKVEELTKRKAQKEEMSQFTQLLLAEASRTGDLREDIESSVDKLNLSPELVSKVKSYLGQAIGAGR